ncbi:MAG: hypothetical protein IKS41_02370 [Alphaproteobacteria bacterium]|nr:hypothetical protein [Alphaproteobacteria bacterium]
MKNKTLMSIAIAGAVCVAGISSAEAGHRGHEAAHIVGATGGLLHGLADLVGAVNGNPTVVAAPAVVTPAVAAPVVAAPVVTPAPVVATPAPVVATPAVVTPTVVTPAPVVAPAVVPVPVPVPARPYHRYPIYRHGRYHY